MAALIFDFDGTLADSFATMLDIFRELTDNEHVKDPARIEELRGKAAREVIRELGLRWWRLPNLLRRGRRRMHDRIEGVPLFPGIHDALTALQDEGYEMYILSSNSPKNIRKFLGQHDLAGHFLDVQGNVGVFGKVGALKRMMRKHRLKPSHTAYIGDEVRDVLAAKRVGLPVVAVAWGYNSRRALVGAEPSAVVGAPSELLRAFRKLIK